MVGRTVIGRFGTIRNNIALKLIINLNPCIIGFGTIRNNIALKPFNGCTSYTTSFGTIRNNIALKPRRIIFLTKFRNRAIGPS